MAASRYDTPSQLNSNTSNQPQTLNQASTTSGNTTQNGQTAQNQQGSTSQTQTSNQTTNTQNMSGSSLAALNLLIQQLLGGGTQEMAQQKAERQAEINNVQATRAGYTKDAAFNDAQGLIAQTLQQTLQQLIPGINRAAEGAGTSQSSMRALLTQQAQMQAANAASAQGLNAAVQYGNINTGLSGVLQNLTQPDNSVTQALLSALNTAKGATTSSTTSGTTQTDGTSNVNTTGSSSQQGTSNQNSNTSTGKNTGAGTTNNPTNVDGLVYYGPQTSTLDTASQAAAGSGTSLQTLLQLASGGNNDWSSGFSF
jgi:hypothetical protein